MKLTILSQAFHLLLLPLLAACDSSNNLPPEEACRKELAETLADEEFKPLQMQCYCAPADDKEEGAWRLSCSNQCESCFDDECVFMRTENLYVKSKKMMDVYQTSCFREGEEEFCHYMDTIFGHRATINGEKCTYAGYCPEDKRESDDDALFKVICNNIDPKYQVDTCSKSDVEKLERGPFRFFAYMFAGTLDEEPTVGSCRSAFEAQVDL